MTTTSSTTATTTSHHEDDGDPLETAILYQSTNPKGAGCGHAVPLGQWSQQQLPRTTCPVCGVPCTYIVDAAADTIRTNHKSNSDDTANPHDPPYPTVLFKYGKLVYRLTVPTTPLVPRQQQQHAVTPWWWIRGWFGGSSAAAESTKTLQRERTAQERIRTVLGIQRHGMKVGAVVVVVDIC